MPGAPVDEGERQEGDGDDRLSVQDDKGEAQQARHIGKQQISTEGQRIIYYRRVAAEPIEHPSCTLGHSVFDVAISA